MWLPRTEEEVVNALASGNLNESESFDAKRELPPPGKNLDIAIDIAAMANYGGVLIYGIDQDSNQNPTISKPLPLAGQRERIEQIVRTSLQEPPRIEVYYIPTVVDAAVGYVVVHVPLSERAPHQVVVKGEYRFFGRTGSQNTKLQEGEIAQLYTRRTDSVNAQAAILSEVISQSPFPPSASLGYLHAFCAPSIKINIWNVLRQSVRNLDLQEYFRGQLERVSRRLKCREAPVPGFGALDVWRWQIHQIAGMTPGFDDNSREDGARALRYSIDENLTQTLFLGRAAEVIVKGSTKEIFADAVACTTSAFFCLCGQMCEDLGYFGSLSIGIAITGVKGAVIFWPRLRAYNASSRSAMSHESYKRIAKSTVSDLCNSPDAEAERLIQPLFDGLSQFRLNPFRDVHVGSIVDKPEEQ